MGRLIWVICSILFTLSATAQLNDDKCHRATEGTEFWFGFMESRNYSPNHYLEITVTAREASDFTISYGKDVPYGNYHVDANSSIQIKIEWTLVEAIGSETIQEKAIHLVSDSPVNVYALNYDSNSSDVAVIFPIESLGKEYFAVCYEPHISEHDDGRYRNGRNSEFLIVASEDNTNVEINPSKVTDKNHAANQTFNITLDKGEVFQVQSYNRENLTGQGDLTGSYILADKPIAFYSGSLATTIPATDGTSAWDHLYEQIPPTSSWGREFYTVPLKSREVDRYRVIAAEDNTTFVIDDVESRKLNKGDVYEFTLYNDEFRKVYADKRIMLVQYSQSKTVDQDYTGGDGDPFMIILSPINQTVNDVTFVAYNSDKITSKYFVNIICYTSELDKMFLDGNEIGSMFKPFKHDFYSYAQIPITQGTHRIECNHHRGFLAYVYGFGGVESYGYGVGFDLDLVLDLGSSLNFNGDTLKVCYGDTLMLDAGLAWDYFEWNTGDTLQKLPVSEGGKYWVNASTRNGCEQSDTINIFMPHPITNIGADTTLCFPSYLDLDAGSGFEKYEWHNNDSIPIFLADTTGIYYVTVTDKYNCTDTDSLDLTVFPIPTIKITGDSLICGPFTTTLTVEIDSLADSYWLLEDNFKWSSTGEDLLTFSNSTHTSTNIEVSAYGYYTIFYELTTINGCTVYDEFKISIQQVPTSNFLIDSGLEKCKDYNRHVLYQGNASDSAAYYWDFGGCKLTDTLNINDFAISIGAYNYNPFVTLFVEEKGCWSDTTKLPVGAEPLFEMNASPFRGCDSLTTFFECELLLKDTVSYKWEFGDGFSSTAQDISHFYPDTGFYDVSLTITNVLTGCENGFEARDMIKVFPTPSADFSADPTLCYGDTTEIYYLNAIDSSFCYWEYDGAHEISPPGLDITKQIIIDNPTALITMKVDEYGCFSPPQTKQVKRKPHFNFSTDTVQGCQPFIIQVDSDPLDDFLEFSWMKDSIPDQNGPYGDYSFPTPGYFTVGSYAQSTETGCIDTLIKENWIWVHPLPVSSFEPDYPIATDKHSRITFTNLSTGAVNYLWDFGEGDSTTVQDPVYTYQNIGEYDAMLVAETEYNCKDTSTFLIQIIAFDVFAPNAFKPESDIEVNRTFMPVGLGADVNRFQIVIYDRWGRMTFESQHPDNKWNGTLKNGHEAPMGNYVWKAHFYDLQGYEHKQTGNVLLIR